MDDLRKKVLLNHTEMLVQSADYNDVFLDKLLDHLWAAGCIQRDQIQIIKRPLLSKTRICVLVEFLSTEGQRAFDELCVALSEFGTGDMRAMASSLRLSMEEKRHILTNDTTHLMEEVRKKVLLDHRQSFINSADDHDLFLDSLLEHMIIKCDLQCAYRKIIKRTLLSQTRMGIFIDFMLSGSQREFDELCNALDRFGTLDKKALAESLRRSYREKLSDIDGSKLNTSIPHPRF